MLCKAMTLENLKQNIDALSEIFDCIRIIDPTKKKILRIRENSLEESDSYCYMSWEHNSICHNCISMRAIKEKSIYFKLEYSFSRIYLVMALPIDDEKIVAELLKDVTESIVVEELQHKDENELISLLGNINQMQVRDSLTGLFNRRFIDERLPVDMLNCNSRNEPLSIIMADIDRFKVVNDTYGHIAGDFVLKELSALLQGLLADKNGWVARYGGEEFLISLANYDREAAEKLAEEIRKSIEAHEIHYDNNTIKITASLGVSILKGKSTVTLEEFVDSADKNLYKAKQNGRNQAVS